jgi:uncharacterized Fe-S cluster-containing radical SAM superfamily protein
MAMMNGWRLRDMRFKATMTRVKYKIRGTDPKDYRRFTEMYAYDFERALEQQKLLVGEGLLDVKIIEI